MNQNQERMIRSFQPTDKQMAVIRKINEMNQNQKIMIRSLLCEAELIMMELFKKLDVNDNDWSQYKQKITQWLDAKDNI